MAMLKYNTRKHNEKKNLVCTYYSTFDDDANVPTSGYGLRTALPPPPISLP